MLQFQHALLAGVAWLWLAQTRGYLEREGLELLVPAFTFPATANVARFLARPAAVRLCDVDADTFCVRQETLAAWLGARRGPALVVHQFGHPAGRPELGSGPDGAAAAEFLWRLSSAPVTAASQGPFSRFANKQRFLTLLDGERLLAEVLVAGSRDGMLTAAHDVSDGGVAQVLVEMALRSGVGARCWVPGSRCRRCSAWWGC